MSIYLAFPDIPASAIRIQPDQIYSDFNPHFNLYRGHRWQHGIISSATASDRRIKFTLPTAGTKSASYAILARADLLLAQGMTAFTLERSTDGTSWTTAYTTTLSTSNLVGPRLQDIILPFTQTSAYQYWRTSIACPSAITKFSKLYFGNLFDIGTYPSDFKHEMIRPLRQNFDADSGAIHQAQTGLSRYQFLITWEGVTEAKCQEFQNLLRPHYNGFFLYAPEQTQILGNNNLVHVKCASYTKEDKEGWPDWNTITCVFEELLG